MPSALFEGLQRLRPLHSESDPILRGSEVTLRAKTGRGVSRRLLTMPSRPSLQAAAKTVAPPPRSCPTRWMPYGARRQSFTSRALRSPTPLGCIGDRISPLREDQPNLVASLSHCRRLRLPPRDQRRFAEVLDP